MVLWEGVELGTGVGKGTNSKQIDILEAGIQIEGMGASTGSGKGVSSSCPGGRSAPSKGKGFQHERA